jgi:hypothetical protein
MRGGRRRGELVVCLSLYISFEVVIYHLVGFSKRILQEN